MTTHDCQSWNTYRETLRAHSHDVDGVTYVGGRGVRLDTLLEASYVDEANQLGNDLAEVLSALPHPVAEQTLESMKGALGHAATFRAGFRPGPEPIHTEAMIDRPGVTTGEVPVLDPIEEPRRGRGRRRDDAAGALADERDGTEGLDATDLLDVIEEEATTGG